MPPCLFKKLVRAICILLFWGTILETYSQVYLTVDTVYFQEDENSTQDDSCNTIMVFWRICNSGKTIKNFNPPWYSYPGKVVTDSIYTGTSNNRVIQKGIGNTKAVLIVDDRIVDICSLYEGYITAPITNEIRKTIKTNECIDGKSAFSFNFSGIDSVCSVVVEYNSIFQTDNKNDLWRGRLVSEPYRLYLKSEYPSK